MVSHDCIHLALRSGMSVRVQVQPPWLVLVWLPLRCSAAAQPAQPCLACLQVQGLAHVWDRLPACLQVQDLAVPALGPHLQKLTLIDLPIDMDLWTARGPCGSLTKLQLEGAGLSYIPDFLPELAPNLKHASFSGNNFSEGAWPPGDSLRLWTALEVLELSSAGILFVPTELCAISQLHELLLDHNPISSLPKEVSQLTSLQVLDLHACSFSGLPREVLQLTCLDVLSLAWQEPNIAGDCCMLQEPIDWLAKHASLDVVDIRQYGDWNCMALLNIGQFAALNVSMNRPISLLL